jgi:hypothetical protein
METAVAMDADQKRDQGHRNREYRRQWAKKRDKAGREIGPAPPPIDQDRRERAIGNLRFFLETYFPLAFPVGWSPDHLEVIAKIE